jgi:hypothetical protein
VSMIYKVLIIALIHLVNFIVVTIVNIYYVKSLANSSSESQQSLSAIQFGMGLFKWIWPLVFVNLSMMYVEFITSAYISSRNRLILSIFNLILIPCIATMAYNKACFYYVFQPADDIVSTIPIFTCNSVNVDGSCENYEKSFITSSSSPAFCYNYSCGSALLQSYIPVLIYFYVNNLLFNPLCQIIKYGIFNIDEKKWRLGKCLKFIACVNHFSVDGADKLHDMIQHIFIFLTFGMASSILGIMIGVSILVQYFVDCVLMGRLIKQTYAPSSTEKEKGMAHALEWKIKNSYQVMNSSKNIIIVAVLMFWGYLFADMVGDDYGSYPALSVTTITIVLLPITIFWMISATSMMRLPRFEDRVKTFRRILSDERDDYNIGIEVIKEVQENESSVIDITNNPIHDSSFDVEMEQC